MLDIKRLAVTATIAILFTILIFSFINAFYENPEYGDFCSEKPRTAGIMKDDCPATSASEEETSACDEIDGYLMPAYEGGCPTSYSCETCNNEYKEARKKHDFFTFVMSGVLGLIAIILSIYIPYKKGSLKEYLLAGFLIGGLLALFIGTGNYFSDLHRLLKPVIILLEIILMIFVGYKKLNYKK